MPRFRLDTKNNELQLWFLKKGLRDVCMIVRNKCACRQSVNFACSAHVPVCTGLLAANSVLCIWWVGADRLGGSAYGRCVLKIASRLVSDWWVGRKISDCKCNFRAFQIELDNLPAYRTKRFSSQKVTGLGRFVV